MPAIVELACGQQLVAKLLSLSSGRAPVTTTHYHAVSQVVSSSIA